MSSTAPPIRPSTATIANGTRNQVGSTSARAPIGSEPMSWDSCWDEPASSSPKTMSTAGPSAPPNVVQPNTPRLDDRRGR